MTNGKVSTSATAQNADAGEEFSEHRLGLGDRQRQQQFDGAEPAFLGSESHGDGEDQPNTEGMK